MSIKIRSRLFHSTIGIQGQRASGLQLASSPFMSSRCNLLNPSGSRDVSPGKRSLRKPYILAGMGSWKKHWSPGCLADTDGRIVLLDLIESFDRLPSFAPFGNSTGCRIYAMGIFLPGRTGRRRILETQFYACIRGKCRERASHFGRSDR